MSETKTLNLRVDAELKQQAELIFSDRVSYVYGHQHVPAFSSALWRDSF